MEGILRVSEHHLGLQENVGVETWITPAFAFYIFNKLATRSRLTRPLFQRVRDSVFNETRGKQVKIVPRW